MSKKVGFIGLGAMGRWMSANLLKAGYSLNVYDLNQEAVEALVRQGAVAADSAAAASAGADVVVLMLPSSPNVENAVLGEKGVLEGAASGVTIIDMSSITPTTTKNVASKAKEKGIDYLDAPVSGGIQGAKDAALTIMVGGDEDAFRRNMDVLEAMGKKILHVGPTGAGQTIKMMNQILCGVQMLAIAEAFTIGVKAGADPEVAFDIIKESAGSSWILQNRMPEFIFKGEFDKPGFILDLQRKDLGIALETAKDVKVPAFFTSLAYNLFTAASDAGKGNLEMCSVVTVLEELANVKIRSAKCEK